MAWLIAGVRRVAVAGVDDGHHLIGGEYLQRRYPCRFRKAMGVTADEQRPGGPLGGAVFDDSLGDGQNM